MNQQISDLGFDDEINISELPEHTTAYEIWQEQKELNRMIDNDHTH